MQCLSTSKLVLNGEGQCAECPSTAYYSDGACFECDEECGRLKCQQGQYWSNPTGNCLPCADNCLDCTNEKCYKCDAGFANLPGIGCKKCLTGERVD